MDLSVIIVTYHSRDDLMVCLSRLPEAAPGLESEIVVVDNASADGVGDALAHAHPEAQLIQNLENVGYSRAVNQGLRATRGRFALILNPDCELNPGAVTRLVDYLSANARTGIAAPRILNSDGTLEYSVRAYPDQFTFLFNRYSLLTHLFPRNRWSRRYLMTDWDHASEREADWVAGACMLVRRAAVDEVGGMDEAFFMFNEDVDWCRRMNQAGWKVAYVPDAVCIHRVGASRHRTSKRVILERHRGMVHYFHKHHSVPPPLSWIADAMILARGWVMVALNSLRRT